MAQAGYRPHAVKDQCAIQVVKFVLPDTRDETIVCLVDRLAIQIGSPDVDSLASQNIRPDFWQA